MKLNSNLALGIVLFGVVVLGLSLWNIGDMVFGRIPGDLQMANTACWSSILSIVTIGFGIYHRERMLLFLFGLIGILCSILAIIPLHILAFFRSFSGGYHEVFEKLFVSISYANILFVAAIIVGLRDPGRK